MKKHIVFGIVSFLTIVGGLNWLLVGAFDFNLVEKLFGFAPALEKTVYIAVGICAFITLIMLPKAIESFKNQE